LDPEAPEKESAVETATSLVEKALPQSADDKSIGGEMSRLWTLIRNHVQSYYQSDVTLTQIRHIDKGTLVLVGREIPISTTSLVSLLSNPQTRIHALRFCISWVIMSRLELACEAESTLLPVELVECFRSISNSVGQDSSSKYPISSESINTPHMLTTSPTAHMALSSRWRVISGLLLQDSYGNRTDLGDDSRCRNMSKTLRLLDQLLEQFRDEGRRDTERLKSLEGIMHRAARFGFLLFSQPSLWKFDWDQAPIAGRKSFVVFPGLLQIADVNGQPTLRPRIICEQEVIAV
jgi:hypothetical protein